MRYGRLTIAAAAMVAASPAAAQGWAPAVGAPAGPSIGRQVDRIDRDIRRAGQLDRREAKRLRRENRQIDTLADRYATGGLSAAERAELQTRTEVMRAQVLARRTQPGR